MKWGEFLYNFCLSTFHFLRTERDTIKLILVFLYNTRYSCQILLRLEISRHIFEKYSNIKFNGNPFSGRRVVSKLTDPQGGRQIDITQRTVALRSFVKAPKKDTAHNVFSYPHTTEMRSN